MAKVAVLFFAVLAVQAAFGGVARYQDNERVYQGDEVNKYYEDAYAVVKDLSLYLRTPFPNNKQGTKIVTWQCHKLAETVQYVMNKIQKDARYYGEYQTVFQKILSELQEVHTSLQQAAIYTDITDVSELKNQLNTNLQTAFEQIEQYVNFIYAHFPQNEGSIYVTVRGLLMYFTNTVKNIHTEIMHIKEDTRSDFELVSSPKNLVMQIQEITGELVQYFHREFFNAKHVQLTLHQYTKRIQLIVQKLQVQTTLGDRQVDVVMQILTNKFREILAHLEQLTTESTIDGKEWRYELVRYFQEIAAIFEQLMQVTKTDFEQFEADNFVEKIMNEYYFAIRSIFVEFQTGYEGFYYGKHEMAHPKIHIGPTEKFVGRREVFQMYAVVSDLTDYLETVYLDNVYVKRAFFNLVREYIRHLEIIYEKLQQATYTNEVTVGTQTLKQYIVALRQLVNTDAIFNDMELKREFVRYVHNIAQEFEKYTTYVRDTTFAKTIFVEYLTYTRHMLMKIQTIATFAPHGQTTNDFEIQIQTLANELTGALRFAAIDNKQAKQIFYQQYREFAQNLETIIMKLKTVTFDNEYTSKVFQEVFVNLKQIVDSHERFAELEDAEQIKMHFIMVIQNAATEIQKLLWAGQYYTQQNQFLTTALYGIFNDFVAVLQNQHIELQNIYETNQHKYGAHHLAMQIQAITNNVALFLQNFPSNDVLVRQKIEIQARKYAQRVAHLVDRLELLDTYIPAQGYVAMREVAGRLRQIAINFEKFNQFNHYTSIYDLAADFHFLLQNVASELRKLAWFAEYQMEETHGYMKEAIRTMLMEYLVVIQNVQIKVQRVNQIVQVGQSPKELALQIQIVARRTIDMLRVVMPDDKVSQYSFVWQTRRFYQVLDVLVNHLYAQIATGNTKTDMMLQEVAHNLKTICMRLEQILTDKTAYNVHQLKMELIATIRKTSFEIQKLMWVAQSEIQQGQGVATKFVNGILFDYLVGLQNFQVQYQENYQLAYTTQNPTTLTMQIQSVAQRLTMFFQYVQPNQVQFKETLVIQVGEFIQTIENMIHLLQTEVKHTQGKNVMFKEIVAKLSEISLFFQQFTDFENKFDMHDFLYKFNMNIHRVVDLIQELGLFVEYQHKETLIGTQTQTINAVFNNLLATLRNMLVQVEITYQFGEYKQTSQELANRIQTINNNLLQTLQTIVGSTKHVKQALDVQAIKYARHIKYILERLEMEVMYDKTMNVEALREIKENMKQVVVALHQMGGSLAAQTITDLKLQFNTQIQNVAAQIQKFALVQTFQQPQGYVKYVVKSILIEYLATIQNLHIQVQNIARMSHEGDNLQLATMEIDTTVLELINSFQRYTPNYQLAEKTIVVEAREFAKIITNIVARFQSAAALEHQEVFQEIASELKEFQLFLQRFADEGIEYNMQERLYEFAVRLQHATVAIEKLMWVIPSDEKHVQFRPNMPTFARVTLYDFLASVQNMHIQIQNAIHVNVVAWGVQDKQLTFPKQYRDVMYHRGMYQIPKQYMQEIQKALDNFYYLLQNNMFNEQEVKQVMTVYIQKLVRFIETVVEQLQQQTGKDEKFDFKVYEIVKRMRDIEMHLRKMTGYTTYITVAQFKIEFYNHVQAVVEQIEQLYYIGYEMPENHFTYVIKNVLKDFYYYIENVYVQMYQVYGQMNKYSYEQEYPYGKINKYNKDAKYDQFFGKYDQNEQMYKQPFARFFDQYEKTYKYNKDAKYDQFFGKYNQEAKYDQFFGKYGQDEQMYKHPFARYFDQYEKTYKYNKDAKYDQFFGKYGQDEQMYKYPFNRFFNKYDNTYKYNKDAKYDQYFGKYGQEEQLNQYPFARNFDQYEKTYKYNKDAKYDQFFGQDEQMYKYPFNRFFNKYGNIYKYNKDAKYDQYFGKYGQEEQLNQYPFARNFDQYEKTYKYNKDAKYDQFFGQDEQMYKYPVGRYFNKYGNTYKYNKDAKYDQYFGKYNQEEQLNQYPFARYFGQYGKTYKYNKDAQYDQFFGKYGQDEQMYKYPFNRYFNKYENTLKYNQYDQFFGKYGQDEQMYKYPFARNFDQYEKTYKYNKDAKYDQFFGQDEQMYKYPFDRYFNKYGNTYKYNKDARFFGKYGQDEQMNKYVYGNNFYNMQYEYQYQTIEQLTMHMQTLVKKAVQHFQTTTMDNQQFIYHARQFIQVIEYILNHMQNEMKTDKVFQQVYFNLQQVHTELRKMINTNFLTNTYKFKVEFINHLEVVATELYKLATFEGQQYVAKNFVVYYITYLHKLVYDFPVHTYGVQTAQKMLEYYPQDYTHKQVVNPTFLVKGLKF